MSGVARVAAVAMIAGCGGAEPDAAAWVVRDSAGIAIVESSRPAWSEGERWSVGPEPLLQVGTREGDEAYLLDQISGVVRLPDGGIAVANMGDNTIRFYAADGTYRSRVGGSGEGPAEFSQLMGLDARDGELWGRQFGLRPFKVFATDGDFLRAESPPAVTRPEGSVSLRGVLDDGSFLLSTNPQGMPLEEGVYDRPAVVLRATPDGAVTVLDTIPGARFVAVENRFANWQEYAPLPFLVPGGAGYYHAFPEAYEIHEADLAGRPVRSIRRRWDPPAVTEQHRQHYVDGMLDMGMEGGGAAPPELLQQRRMMAEAMILPERHAAFRRLVVDRTGHIWTERVDPLRPRPRSLTPVYESPTTWDVFQPGGRWLGALELPERFWVLEIGPDWIAGRWADENDVQYARVYPLDRSPGS